MKQSIGFLGTYFDRDSVFEAFQAGRYLFMDCCGRLRGPVGPVCAGYILQLARGQVYALGFTDYAQQILNIVETAFQGCCVFFVPAKP